MNGFERRLSARRDELDWLYMELYHDREMLEGLKAMMARAYGGRSESLRRLDKKREADPEWFRAGKMLGVTMYPGLFAGSLKGVEEKLGYLKEQGITYVHLMPLLKMPHPDNDGGYAVEDFNQVDPTLGTNEELSRLAAAMRRRGMSLCLDFVINHTADTHEWAARAKAGEREYQDRYICFDTPDIPREMEKTIPDVFPETAPGSFLFVPEMGRYVCSSFHPYQWDLNYRNPAVFNDMAGSMLHLANLGVEVLRIDAVPYLWKELGTSCRNLPQVHTLTRMIRLAVEIVCPGVLLLGEVVMEPAKVAPYFGTTEKPECHMLYNVTTMATTWHTLAVGDASLLRRQMEILCSLPRDFLFLNYLRCHDDIGWGLDYPWLGQRFGTDEVAHKKYLNDWFTGKFPGSNSRGELYNDDPRLGDARLCGATASLCGVEAAEAEGDPFRLEQALSCDLTLHAWMLSQSGIPVIYSGDEVGQLNDWRYREDPEKREDSRYIHRGDFQWDLAERRKDPETRQGKLFQLLRRMERLRAQEPCFDGDAEVWVEDGGDSRVLALCRRKGDRELVCLFNFSRDFVRAGVDREGGYAELMYGNRYDNICSVELYPTGFAWLLREQG